MADKFAGSEFERLSGLCEGGPEGAEGRTPGVTRSGERRYPVRLESLWAGNYNQVFGEVAEWLTNSPGANLNA